MDYFSHSKHNKGRLIKYNFEKQTMSVKIALNKLKVSQLILVLFLLILMVVGAVPGYLKGKWSWQQPQQVANLQQLRGLQETGITLPDWQTVNQKPLQIGGHKWSFQSMQRDAQTQAIVLLRPQRDRKDQPQVEWVDLNGFQWWQTNQPRKWQTDQYRDVQFTVPATAPGQQPGKVEAQFFRKWIPDQNFSGTFAVLQWYAWPGGGHPNPSRWFWADQTAQWQGYRVPWVAVSILMPIEPLGEVEKAWPQVQSLAQNVQTALMAGPFIGK
jgi:cyanoexosortase B-associated protein